MTTKTIPQLQEELQKELNDYGVGYSVHSSTTCGNTKINGKHISFHYPVKTKVNLKEITELFERYFGRICWVGKPRRVSFGGNRTFYEVTLNLEAGWDDCEKEEEVQDDN